MAVRSSANLIGIAADLGERVLRTASVAADGSLTWNRGYDVRFEPTADAGLFSGRIGEALLFAALAKSLNAHEFADAAERVIGPLRTRLGTPGGVDIIARENGLGLVGLGSILYGLVRIATYIDSPTLASEVRRAVGSLSASTIDGSDHDDIFWGVSGLIPGLLAVAALGDDAAVAWAKHCGTRLLARRVPDSVTQLRAWATRDGQPSAGFAHGSTGIAHSLLQLYRVTNDAEYRSAALDAFAFERALRPENGTAWPDTREDTGPPLCTWCHGAAGIGFSRLGAIESSSDGDDSAVLADLRSTIDAVLSFDEPGGLDNLCCGQLGRADLLLEAGRVLRDLTFVDRAGTMVSQTVDAAIARGWFVTPRYDKPHVQPGLWQGVTGVAFELLRAAAVPADHPSVLSFSLN